MNLDKMHGKALLCFSRAELEALHHDMQILLMKKEMHKQGVTLEDLEQDWELGRSERFRQLAYPAASLTAQDRDEHEVFFAWQILHEFFQEEDSICFEASRDYVPGKTQIETMQDLHRYRDDALGDCIIKSKDGYRIFQLKRYRGALTAPDLSEFIKNKIDKYGNLGDTNLLVILQPQLPDVYLDDIDFDALHVSLKEARLRIDAQILLAFNANNNFSVIYQLYPDLAEKMIPIKNSAL